MRKALYLGAALLVCSAVALAQYSGSTSSPSQSGSDANTQSGTTADQNSSTAGDTFQGCLMGSNGSYTLTDATGTTYQLQGDDSELSANANKQVEVMGTAGSSSASASGTDNGSSGSAAGTETSSQGGSTSGAPKTLNVTSIHKIADSCGNSQSPQ